MLDLEPQDGNDAGVPAPSFPTDAEIEFADELRHRLEQRYLGSSIASARLESPSNERRRSQSAGHTPTTAIPVARAATASALS